MRPRFHRIIAALATAVAVASCTGADGIPGPDVVARKSDASLLAGFNASAPIANAVIAADRTAAHQNSGVNAEVSYVSLVPGTVPDGTTATVSNLRTAERLTVPIVDGGFDPQPIPASPGDTLQVTVSRATEPDATAFFSVRPSVPPRIVRTRPPRGQTDAPLNMVITLVFSEPLDPASVNPTSIMLTTGASRVAGALRVVPGPGYAVEFAPAVSLTPATDYVLRVNGVVNLVGTPLATPTSIPFKTTSGTPPTTFIPRGQATREIPVDSHFIAYSPYASDGQSGSKDLPTTWRSRDPSIATVESWGSSQYGYVVGDRPGTTIVEGVAQGATATISVTVLAPAPTSAVSPVVVDFRMLEVQYSAGSNFWSYAPELVVRDTTGRGGTAVIAVSFDLPGLGTPPMCHLLRPVGSSPTEVFHETYGDFELTLDGGGGARVSGTEAIAHITLRIPGPAAMTIDVPGPIVPGSFPTTYTGGYPVDALTCG